MVFLQEIATRPLDSKDSLSAALFRVGRGERLTERIPLKGTQGSRQSQDTETQPLSQEQPELLTPQSFILRVSFVRVLKVQDIPRETLLSKRREHEQESKATSSRREYARVERIVHCFYNLFYLSYLRNLHNSSCC